MTTFFSEGYAVAHSTGTVTGTHYNLNLSEETMMMVKDQFIKRYGTPEYTVGVGGSGGGIQQYAIGQSQHLPAFATTILTFSTPASPNTPIRT